MNKLPAIYLLLCYTIGHFRVPPGLCFKTRLSAQPLIWKWFFILMQIKLLSTRKVVHLASFWKWGFLELGSGLLYWGIQCNVVTPSCSNKPSSNVLLTERNRRYWSSLVLEMAPLVSCTAVLHPWFSDLPLKIDYKERLLQGKIEIIWLCININKKIFFSVYRRNNYVLHKIIVQRHFWQKHFFQGLPNQVGKLQKFQGVGGMTSTPWNGNSRGVGV